GRIERRLLRFEQLQPRRQRARWGCRGGRFGRLSHVYSGLGLRQVRSIPREDRRRGRKAGSKNSRDSLGLTDDRPEAVEARCADALFGQSRPQRAAGCAAVLAVAKFAAAEPVAKLDEAALDLGAVQVIEAEFADARRVDQIAAARQMEQSRRGGGVATLGGGGGELADTDVEPRNQRAD